MGSRQNVDRLSNMPEEVISHILSLMPTKFAVRTSVLSKSWIHTWKSVTNLDFDDQHPFRGKHCFIKSVDRVLECCKSSQVQLFRLRSMRFCVDESRVCKWIDAAVRLNVCELDIKAIYYVLPHSLFTCKTLTKLRLDSIDASTEDHGDPPYVNLPCLKTIDIDVLCKATLLNLIRGSPVLESLSLKIYDHFNEDYNFNIPTLKYLKLSIQKRIIRVSKVVLNVPKLEDLYVGLLISTVFVMEDLSSLISVTLSGYKGSDPFWINVLKGVTGAKSLTLDEPYHLMTSSYIPIPNFPYLKHLKFNPSSSEYGFDWPLIHQILENSPELEHLCIEEKPGISYWAEPEDSCWIEPQSVPTCMLNNLRTIKFVNFLGRKSDIQFMAYMLGNAKVLKTLAIMCDSFPLEEELRLNAELLKLPRASRYCEIHFVASRSRSKSMAISD